VHGESLSGMGITNSIDQTDAAAMATIVATAAATD